MSDIYDDAMDKRDHINNVVEDIVSDLLYYDRKEDEDLPLGAIEALIAQGIISPQWIAQKFLDALVLGLK